MPQPISQTVYQALIDDILNYIDFLRAAHKIEVTLHLVEQFAHADMFRFLPYNIHSNPLCVCVKSTPHMWRHCIDRQFKVLSKTQEGAFFGMCWIGVSEFVFPIRDRVGRSVAFISVGGYAGDREKAMSRIAYNAQRHSLDKAQLVHLFDHGLKKEKPDMDALGILIRPLANQITLLIEFFIDIHEQRGIGRSADAFYNTLLHFLNENHMRDISLESISNRFNCSPSHLSHLFHRYNQCSLPTFINRLRVETAKIYLTNTQMSIQEVAFEVGFNDSNYFSTVFKRLEGMTPREWRRKR